ncbi:unnamed protein product [Allacma fusca]|uniref:Uncharacterized protein n=1 Tax=Allacma fusca TaxID=39272 RepID=A0A8J2P347_9HEXA|nr:unnamed protein product [Allacma fusca]
MLNPCCCVTPRIGTFVFGVLDFVYSVVILIEAIQWLFDHGLRDNIVWAKLAFGGLLLFMAVLLLVGAWRNAADKVRLWLFIWAIYVILLIAFLIFDVYRSTNVSPWKGSGIAFVLLFIYEIWVVWAYLHELQYGPAGLTYCPTQLV